MLSASGSLSLAPFGGSSSRGEVVWETTEENYYSSDMEAKGMFRSEDGSSRQGGQWSTVSGGPSG